MILAVRALLRASDFASGTAQTADWSDGMSVVKNEGHLPALVVGLDNLTGLQTARILASHGIQVFATATRPEDPRCRTNVCERIIIANDKSPNLVDELQAFGERLQSKAVLIPTSDDAVLAVSRARQRLCRWYEFSLPEESVIEMLMDKASFQRYAQAHGLPIPATFFLHDRCEAAAASRQMRYPCILKPGIKTARWHSNAPSKVYKIHSADELLRAYDQCAAWSDILLAQEWITGSDADLYSCNCYFNSDSVPLVTFVARKLRQWPAEIGSSCLGQECRNDDVLRQTVELFQALRFQGLAYLEMKRDSRDGRYYIIEPNVGRPTGRSAIAEAGGVELLYTMYCDLLRLPLPAAREQKYRGVKWMFFRADLQSAAWYWRRGQLSLPDVLRSWRGVKVDAVFSWKDPLPFLYDIRDASVRLFRRRNNRALLPRRDGNYAEHQL